MSLRAQDQEQVPTETAEVARAALPKGHAYLTLRDKFGTLFPDELFRKLFAWRGQPAEAPGRLAVVTILQFAEGLSDQQAADAVRSRLDWKYLLALELKDPGFDASVLSEFRSRLVAGGAEQLLFETVLKHLGEAGLLKPGGRARTDATHVLTAVRSLHRLECVGETLRQALDVLAIAVPQWLRAQVPPEWFERYGQRFEDYRLPVGQSARSALAEQIGADGFQLLGWIYAPRHRPGFDSCQRWTFCARSGCSSFMPPRRTSRCAGGKRPTCHLRPRRSARPMMPRRAMPRSARRFGSATKCI